MEFVAPLVTERRRGQDEDAANAPPEQQFGEDQPGLDGLAEADVVGDQQADARHREGFQQRDELVVLDPDAAVERAGHRLWTERAVAVRVEPGGESGPARGAEEGVEVLRRHGGHRRVGESVRFEERALRLEFPEEAFRGGRAPVLVFDVDEVEASGVAGG